MGFIDSLFGSSDNKDKPQSQVLWHALTSHKQLEEIIEASHDKPMLIFKHSTRCGISRMALKRFESEYSMTPEAMDAYFLDLLSYREVSNAVANAFGVLHQSPQIILVKNGVAIYDASHGSIDATVLDKVL